jgi:hypothetical protein
VKNELIMRKLILIIDRWAGMYSVWDQIRDKDRKMLEKLHRVNLSIACDVGQPLSYAVIYLI